LSEWGGYEVSRFVECVPFFLVVPVVFFVVAILTKRFEIIPRKRYVWIVDILLRQVCFVMCDLRGYWIVRR
jgi:hypothetical protein